MIGILSNTLCAQSGTYFRSKKIKIYILMFRRLDTTSNLESFSFRKGSKNKKIGDREINQRLSSEFMKRIVIININH